MTKRDEAILEDGRLQGSNSLTDLAARIQLEHLAVSTALKDSVRHAIAAGELLLEAKKQVGHGQWLTWLERHCSISERTAQLYMRCSKNRAAIEEQIRNGIADLSLNEAAAVLMLSSDVRKLLEMVKTMEGLQGDDLVKFCADNDIAMLSGNIFGAPEPTDQEWIEWHIFVLFLASKQGYAVEGAWHHADWVRSRGTRLVDWMQPNPIRDKWMPIPQAVFDEWDVFLEANRDRSLADVRAELEALEALHAERQACTAITSRRRRRRRAV
jgi:hypothetical protein